VGAMPDQLPTPVRKARALGVLAIAVSIPALALLWSQLDGDDRPAPPALPTDQPSTAPTVLAEEIVASTSLPVSAPASPAPLVVPDPPDGTSSSSSTPPPTLIPPVTVTSPTRRTTTTPPDTTTTAPPTTTPAHGDS
jgi:hypothetical protein